MEDRLIIAREELPCLGRAPGKEGAWELHKQVSSAHSGEIHITLKSRESFPGQQSTSNQARLKTDLGTVFTHAI